MFEGINWFASVTVCTCGSKYRTEKRNHRSIERFEKLCNLSVHLPVLVKVVDVMLGKIAFAALANATHYSLTIAALSNSALLVH